MEAEVEWRGAPGTLPLMSPSKDWLVCFSAHYDDPSAVLLPEAHFLMHRWYRPLRVELAMSRRPWGLRANRASYAGSDHTAESPNTHGPALRRHLKKLADQGEFAIDVSLGKSTSRRQQLRNKYLIDIDGFARTWDAWAWKMLSGSVVLSPASIWQTRFTREFEPWQHYVPLASDLSDLGDQLEWCQSHDQECKEMSDRARRHACRVYDHRRVERVTAELLRPRLGLNQAHPT
ncbi:MAG TPA: glycosyl transferase family 90 [Mycobacteriales bacterium]|nr:glycosyl transferase family 90 [Mycobacteriales bacterium]